MGKTASNLTKTCSGCGLQKPLTAFLEVAGPQGASYGNLCADCRKAQMDKAVAAPKEPEESTTSRTGHRIGAKERMQVETDHKELFKKTEDLYHEGREKEAEQQAKQHERKADFTTKEKRHREDYLQKRTYSQNTIQAEAQRITEARQKALEQEAKETHNAEHTQMQEQATLAEQKEKEIKMDTPVDVMRVTGKLAVTHGLNIKAFATWLGKDSPFVRTLEQAGQKADPKESSKLKEKATDRIEKTWGPDSKRKR